MANNKLQELNVLVKTAPYIEEQIKAKYRHLHNDYLNTVEKLSREKYSGLGYKTIDKREAERLARPIKDQCDQQFGSIEERKKWEKEEIALLHNTICTRAYELFPELIYKK